MNRPPALPFRLSDLSSHATQRLQSLQDIFGAVIMWSRSQTLGDAARKLEDGDARRELGNTFRKAYDDVARLGDMERAAALKLAERCVDNFAVLILAALANNGFDLRLASGEAVRFPLDIELFKPSSGESVLRERIGAGAGFLPNRWGRWLNDEKLKKLK